MKKIYFVLEFLNKGSTVLFYHLLSSALLISLNFTFICVLSFCPFASLIRMASPQLLRINEGLLYKGVENFLRRQKTVCL
jgi:hypothetical protein